jgi:hypothetical protein
MLISLVRVRRQQGERFREDCFVGTVMAGGGSVHVWGRIHHGGKTDLVVLQNSVNDDRYIDNTRTLPSER